MNYLTIRNYFGMIPCLVFDIHQIMETYNNVFLTSQQLEASQIFFIQTKPMNHAKKEKRFVFKNAHCCVNFNNKTPKYPHFGICLRQAMDIL